MSSPATGTGPAFPPPSRRRGARAAADLPAVCLAAAALQLNLALVLALLAGPDFAAFFYQPRVLAVTHALTLGWISLAIIGVLYRYVPALTKHPLRRMWLARLQIALFVVGGLGMVSHFWIGRLAGMVWSAALVAVSVVMLLALLLPLLVRSAVREATVMGIGVALLLFLGAAVLGMRLAFRVVHPSVQGHVFSGIAAHAHLALVGWVTLVICVVSYRMVAAFALPTKLLSGPARGQIVSLALSAPALVMALLWCRSALLPLAVAAGASLGWYVLIMVRLVRARRLPVDWGLRHVLAALVYLVGAIACGLAFALGLDPTQPVGARLAFAYGAIALLGWVSNYILGIGGRLIPGLVPAGEAGEPLLAAGAQAIVFWCFNLGAVGVATALFVGAPRFLAAALLLTLVASALFGLGVVRRTLGLLRGSPTRSRLERAGAVG